MKRLSLTLLLAGALAAQTVTNGGRNVKGALTAAGSTSSVDFTNAGSTSPVKSGTTAPTTCKAGDLFFNTAAAAGQNLYLCASTNNWTQLTGTGGGGGAGNPGGTNGQIQYNNLGSFGGYSVLPDAVMPADVPVCAKYTVTTSGGNWTVNGSNAGAVASATAQNVTLFTMPANGQMTALRIKHSTAFSGGTITALTVSLGTVSTAAVYAPAFDVFQATGSTVFYDDGGAWAADSASHSVVAAFASAGANLSAITAGSVDVWACTRTLP